MSKQHLGTDVTRPAWGLARVAGEVTAQMRMEHCFWE